MAQVGVGYTKIASLSGAVGLGTVPAGATSVLLQAETKDVRLRFDDTAPTATDGFKLVAGTPFAWAGDFSKVQAIETSASATLHVTWFKN